MAYVLVINAGSSSIKYQVMDMKDESLAAKGIVERIGIHGSILKHSPTGKDKFEYQTDMPDHGAAMEQVIAALLDKEHGVVGSLDEIAAIGHRVLHGGEEFKSSVVVDEDVLRRLAAYIELGPLHMPANITGIETCMQIMPGKPNVAVFDTAFHQTLPDYAYLYGLPYEDYEAYKIRKYGFHGTSHMFLAREVARMTGRDDLKIITCHLGNGSSVAAVKDGKCLDTTMGLTPLEGLIMGTRSGDIDPAAIPFLMDKKNMTADEVINYLNKKSGVLGISGLSSDFRDLDDASNEGNKRAKIAVKMFAYRLKKFIGSYAAIMGGVDVIVFGGGVGENDHVVRATCLEGLEFLGISINKEANISRGAADLTGPDSTVKIWVVPTNEELMIARDTRDLTGI